MTRFTLYHARPDLIGTPVHDLGVPGTVKFVKIFYILKQREYMSRVQIAKDQSAHQYIPWMMMNLFVVAAAIALDEFSCFIFLAWTRLSVVLYNVSQNDDNCVGVQGVYIEGRGAAANPNPNLYDKKALTCITRNIV
jgi:hypothetical protein